jgi:hypothetical protein
MANGKIFILACKEERNFFYLQLKSFETSLLGKVDE